MAMRKRTVLTLSVAASALLAGAVHPAVPEMDMDLMQTIEDTNKSLASNIALRDAKASTADASGLAEMFAQVEAHFAARGDAANAVDLSKKSRELARQIIASVAAGNFDSASGAATDLSRTCRTCHTFYKRE